MKRCKIFIIIVWLLIGFVSSVQARVRLLPDFIDDNPFELRINSATISNAEKVCSSNGGHTQLWALSNNKTCPDSFSVTSGGKTYLCYKGCYNKW